MWVVGSEGKEARARRELYKQLLCFLEQNNHSFYETPIRHADLDHTHHTPFYAGPGYRHITIKNDKGVIARIIDDCIDKYILFILAAGDVMREDSLRKIDMHLLENNVYSPDLTSLLHHKNDECVCIPLESKTDIDLVKRLI